MKFYLPTNLPRRTELYRYIIAYPLCRCLGIFLRTLSYVEYDFNTNYNYNNKNPISTAPKALALEALVAGQSWVLIKSFTEKVCRDYVLTVNILQMSHSVLCDALDLERHL